MTTIIDGVKISKEILAKVKEGVAKLPFSPIFCDVLVGENKISMQYVNMKGKAAASVGISFRKANFPTSVSTEELVKEIKLLNSVPNMCGLIIQLPLPEHIDTRQVLDAVSASIDVDCLSTAASERFYKNEKNSQNFLGLPTALACMYILDSLDLDLRNKKIVVMGQGSLVGKPVTALLESRGLFPVAIRNKTEDKKMLIMEADIIISGIGKGKFITGDMIKHGAILIDAGASELDAGIVGDVDLESVQDVASYVSPVPGGVGPVTVAMLLSNVLKVAEERRKTHSL